MVISFLKKLVIVNVLSSCKTSIFIACAGAEAAAAAPPTCSIAPSPAPAPALALALALAPELASPKVSFATSKILFWLSKNVW